jgi:hypothetical protein
MDVAAFIAEYRRVTGDTVDPYLWSDAFILSAVVEALNEACERALLIEDRTTPACCAITIVAGTDTYALHSSVIKVKRVVFRGRALEESSVEAEDRRNPVWESQTGEPKRYILTERELRLVPNPVAGVNGETLALTVYRRELVARSLSGAGAEAPEINERYHLRLMNWLFFKGYSKRDAETLDPVKAETFEALFTADFGARVDANVQRKQRDRRPPVVRYCGL